MGAAHVRCDARAGGSDLRHPLEVKIPEDTAGEQVLALVGLPV